MSLHDQRTRRAYDRVVAGSGIPRSNLGQKTLTSCAECSQLLCVGLHKCPQTRMPYNESLTWLINHCICMGWDACVFNTAFNRRPLYWNSPYQPMTVHCQMAKELNQKGCTMRLSFCIDNGEWRYTSQKTGRNRTNLVQLQHRVAWGECNIAGNSDTLKHKRTTISVPPCKPSVYGVFHCRTICNINLW